MLIHIVFLTVYKLIALAIEYLRFCNITTPRWIRLTHWKLVQHHSVEKLVPRYNCAVDLSQLGHQLLSRKKWCWLVSHNIRFDKTVLFWLREFLEEKAHRSRVQERDISSLFYFLASANMKLAFIIMRERHDFRSFSLLVIKNLANTCPSSLPAWSWYCPMHVSIKLHYQECQNRRAEIKAILYLFECISRS